MPPDNLLDNVLATLTNAATGEYAQLTTYGHDIMVALFVLQLGIVVASVPWGDIYTLLHGIFLGLLRMGIIWAIMDHIYDWGGDIIDTGKVIGASLTGLSPDSLTPSGVYSLGLNMIGILLHDRSWFMWLHPGNDVLLLVLIFITWFTWLGAAFVWLWLLLESVFAIATGGILVCWSALEYTVPTIYAWGGWLLNIAIRILVTLIVLSVGTILVQGWVNDLSGLGLTINAHRMFYATQALVESVIFFFVIWYIPNHIGNIIRTHQGGGGSLGSVATAAAGNTLQAGATAAKTAVATVDGAGKSAAQLSNVVRSKLTS